MYKYLLSLLFVSFTTIGIDNWLTDFEQAKVIASNEKKLILLNFSGSDWCVPCISLRKDIFEQDEFKKFAAEKLVLVNADFPRKKANALSKEQTTKNEQLADKYNSKGSFPLTILMTSNGKILQVWDGYYKKGTQSFINEITDHFE
jgi:thioredoxin-related protein